jgi:hypothetical protein
MVLLIKYATTAVTATEISAVMIIINRLLMLYIFVYCFISLILNKLQQKIELNFIKKAVRKLFIKKILISKI